MPKAGVEPARAQRPLDFESSASANFATSALILAYKLYAIYYILSIGISSIFKSLLGKFLFLLYGMQLHSSFPYFSPYIMRYQPF